jgi:error-prone DNA polymerase
VLSCIRHHVALPQAGTLLLPNAERHLRPAAEMQALFRDLPDAVRATLDIAESCTFRMDEIEYRLPRFPVPEGETAFSYLYRLVHQGATLRYHPMTANVAAQLAHELGVIEKLDLAGYFLIVWDIVQFCKEQGILCQGRGSAANSATCYCLGITAVDPIGLDLLFERFLSESRREIPDIDLDIAHAHREKVIQQVYAKYGREHAAMTSEVICFRARSSVRDVGKALGLSPTEVDRISKALGGRGSITDPDVGLSDALLPSAHGEARPLRSKVLRDLVACCREIDDFPRHLGIHVGGMVISREPLCEVVPVEPATMPGRTVIQWNKDDAATRGLVKIDLLGLGMLTLLQEAIRLVELHHGERLDLARIPMDDPDVYALLQQADTVGVFQVESRAQMNTLPRLKPRTFHDLVVEVALIRPGPIQGEMVHPYLRRRAGEEPVTYPHPLLEPILSRTLGVPLFQEQGMKVAIAAGGFSPGEADELRRAMSHARSHRHMEPLMERLRRGMVLRGFSEEAQAQVVKHVESFANFGFAESHAASFALLVAASAWFKVHYPVEFTAALLNAQPMGFYSLSTIAEDARRHGVAVEGVDVNRSAWDVLVEEPTSRPRTGAGLRERVPAEGNGRIRMGLRFVRGLGEGLRPRIESLMRRQPFASLPELVRISGLPRPVIENLAASGALAGFGAARREALWEVGRLVTGPEHGPLFAMTDPVAEREAPELPPTCVREEVLLDHAITGVSSGPHPVSFLREDLRARGALNARELQHVVTGTQVVSAGLVICRQRPGSANGVTFLTLEDEEGFVNVVVRAQIYREHRQLVRAAVLLLVRGKLERSGPVLNVLAQSFEELAFPVPGLVSASRDFH